MEFAGVKTALEWLLRELKKLIPKPWLDILLPRYHHTLALFGAALYRFPSRSIFVAGVTGTKGKTTTIELMHAILEEAGAKPALASTLRFKTGAHSTRNLFKMTMPGRFFLQKFLREAVDAGCTHAVIEMTSEGVKQYRHKGIDLDALIFTNLSPEHIESHGSYEKYIAAKLELARALEASPKRPRAIIANRDDKEGEKFLAAGVEEKIAFGIADIQPYHVDDAGGVFTWEGLRVKTVLFGEFNLYNVLAAAAFAKSQGVSAEAVRRAVEKFTTVPGRMERVIITRPEGGEFTDFDIIVDYAHTPDSLQKVYEALGNKPRVCVLGGTGGGRDRWKRPEMGAIAAERCRKIILTNEDPYDESPFEILNDIQQGIDKKIAGLQNAGRALPDTELILDRREAIEKAVEEARAGEVVIITGKGTDPYICGPHGTKIPWDDATVARNALKTLLIERGD